MSPYKLEEALQELDTAFASGSQEVQVPPEETRCVPFLFSPFLFPRKNLRNPLPRYGYD
jgi:hypothetical protein